MKLSTTQLGVITMLVGILVPMPGFGYSPNRSDLTKYPHYPIRLVQVASYRNLVDRANQEVKTSDREYANLMAIFGQLSRETDRNRSLKLYGMAISASARAAEHIQQSSDFGFKSLPYYAADPSAQTALATGYRIYAEIAEVFRGYGQLCQQSRSALRANDNAKLNTLATKFRMLDEHLAQLQQMNQQVIQAYANRSNAANAQLINNLSTRMGNGLIQRGRATKCMVSNLPYGSSAQIANNASAYCNSP
jgi:phage shock protein A